jgi:hypothetical protein
MDDATSIDDYQPKILKESAGDYAYTTGINLLSLALSAFIPGGQIIAALVGVKQLSPIWKRLDKWMVDIQESLDQLKDSGFKTEDLATNEAFVTFVLQATQVAMRTHQREKLDALRNAVMNSARASAPGDDVQLMFLNFVDIFTVWHLKALQYYIKKRTHKFTIREFLANSGQAPNPSLVKSFPELKEQEPFADQVVRDLLNHGLLSSKAAVTIITPFGLQFLVFISNSTPDEGDSDQK